MDQKKKTLFERVGGKQAVSNVVDKFYDSMLADDRVKHHFKSTDMAKLRQQQKCFLSMIMQGPKDYKGKSMREAHKNMNLANQDFDVMLEILCKTLADFGVKEDIIEEIGVALESMRDDILNR